MSELPVGGIVPAIYLGRGPSIFTLGAAVGHLQQMVSAHNFAPGNTGTISWTGIFIPLFRFTLLRLSPCTADSGTAPILA